MHICFCYYKYWHCYFRLTIINSGQQENIHTLVTSCITAHFYKYQNNKLTHNKHVNIAVDAISCYQFQVHSSTMLETIKPRQKLC